MTSITPGTVRKARSSTQSCTALSWFERVARPLQHVADDLAGRTPGREGRGDPRGQVADHADPVDHFLAGRPVIGAVLELALDVVEPGQRDAPQVFQPRHPVEYRLDRDADQPLHLLGAGARVLRDHLDQRRRGVGIGLDVEVVGRVDAERDQPDRPEQDDEAIVQAPGDQRSNHECYRS